MRFAVVSLALCAAVNAIPVDTKPATGLAHKFVDTSSVTHAAHLKHLKKIHARQVDTSSVTGLADIDSDIDAVTDLVPETSELGVRQVDTSSVTNLVDTDDLLDTDSLIPSTSDLGVRGDGGEDNFLSTASSDSGAVEDLILEVRHIRFAIVKGIKDELKDVDPTIGREVSQIINRLNQFERELFKDVGLPGNLFTKLTYVTSEINKVVKSIEKLLINETGYVDPSLGSLVSQLSSDVGSLEGDLAKIVGL